MSQSKPPSTTSQGVSKSRKSGLTTLDLHLLDRACEPVWDAFGATYLVGTAQTGAYRDVDVRTILHDDEFDRLFGEGVLTDEGEVQRYEDAYLGKGRALWSLICLSVGRMLAASTGLPIDYQVQRMTEANEKYDGPRNPLGRGLRVYAGGGDATRFDGAVLPLPKPITEGDKAKVMEFLASLGKDSSSAGEAS